MENSLKGLEHGFGRLLHALVPTLLIMLTGYSWSSAMASEVIKAQVKSNLVPSPVEYAVVAPEGYRNMKDLPLVLNLHGGGGSREGLVTQQPLWDRLWAAGDIPPAIVVMPSVTARGFYMNFKDGSERWEDFITGPFIEHLRATYPVSRDPKRVFLTGASMGGMGALRMAFRYPDRFGAVAALEPGIEPILKFGDMLPKHRFWRGDTLLERRTANLSTMTTGLTTIQPRWRLNTGMKLSRVVFKFMLKQGMKTSSGCTKAQSFCTRRCGTSGSNTSTTWFAALTTLARHSAHAPRKQSNSCSVLTSLLVLHHGWKR